MIKKLFKKLENTWAKLIFKIKDFFSKLLNTEKKDNQSDVKTNHQHEDPSLQNVPQSTKNLDKPEEEEVWYDAESDTKEIDSNTKPTILEIDDSDDEFFDAPDKFYEKNDNLIEKTHIGYSGQILALAFKINKHETYNSANLQNLKLCEIKETDSGYELHLKDSNNNSIFCHSQGLKIYPPSYFEKCSKKTCKELFTTKDQESNYIICILQAPKTIDLSYENITEKLGYMASRLYSKDTAIPIKYEKLKDHCSIGSLCDQNKITLSKKNNTANNTSWFNPRKYVEEINSTLIINSALKTIMGITFKHSDSVGFLIQDILVLAKGKLLNAIEKGPKNNLASITIEENSKSGTIGYTPTIALKA
ncbi:MAG: hypothetical protein QWI36_01545 [Wolbachia endosymbiont of Tyrophagus putrescentiae]|nr:hypothetical protein [Wolbachia endosymbiont of Tyrophagus putrescentiae]